MTDTLFSIPSERHCRSCGQPVLFEWFDEYGLHLYLEPDRISPLARPPPRGQVAEHHPLLGWWCPWTPRHRGWPLHPVHDCTTQAKGQDA